MTLKIDDTARLPFEMTKGDYQSRCSKIDAANTRLFEKIIENKDDLNLQKLEDLMSDELIISGTNGKLKTKPQITIEKLKNPTISGKQSTIKNNDFITGFKISIPESNGKLKKAYIGAFMHEATHMFELLFEPQILANKAQLDFDENVKKKIENFYFNVLYKIEYFDTFNTILSKIRMNIALKGLSNREKIKVLKEYRNSLMMENFAYMQGEKYEIRAAAKGIKQVENADVFDFQFEKKINFLNKEIAKLIKKEREINKKKLESKN